MPNNPQAIQWPDQFGRPDRERIEILGAQKDREIIRMDRDIREHGDSYLSLRRAVMTKFKALKGRLTWAAVN